MRASTSLMLLTSNWCDMGLIPKPWLIIALIAMLVGSNAITARYFYKIGYGFSEAVWTKKELDRNKKEAAAQAAAQEAAALKQKIVIAGVQKAAEDAYNEQLALETRLSAANDAVDRLRETVNAANSRANSATASAIDGSVARTLLADCAGKYRDVAKEADGLRAIILGLRRYAETVH